MILDWSRWSTEEWRTIDQDPFEKIKDETPLKLNKKEGYNGKLFNAGKLVLKKESELAVFVILTCIWLAVVLPTVFHLDWRQADRLHHFVRPLAPVRGAESRHRQSEGQGGETQGEQGAVSPGHFLQHRCSVTWQKPEKKWWDWWTMLSLWRGSQVWWQTGTRVRGMRGFPCQGQDQSGKMLNRLLGSWDRVVEYDLKRKIDDGCLRGGAEIRGAVRSGEEMKRGQSLRKKTSWRAAVRGQRSKDRWSAEI